VSKKKRVAGKKSEEKTTETGIVVREIPRSTLQGIATWEDVAKVWGDRIVDVREFGDGFKLLRKKQKETLVGKPFVVAAYKFNDGDFGTFVTMHIVTKTNDKFIINDGSTGIKDQLTEFFNKTGQLGGLVCPGGLRYSDYEYEDPDSGELKPARTYYLETSDVSA
jgi:hypothetical protein